MRLDVPVSRDSLGGTAFRSKQSHLARCYNSGHLPNGFKGGPRDHGTEGHPILEKHGKWYVGYVPEVPGVNTQECILKAARSSLMMALHELAEMDPQAVMGGQTAE